MLAETINFLDGVSKNNHKAWVNEHKPEYQKTKEWFLNITADIIHETSDFYPYLGILSPKECMFRLFRDVRFSKGKPPYKTHYSSVISPAGKKFTEPGFYFQINHEGVLFLGGGHYSPEKDTLLKIRKGINVEADELKKALSEPKLKKAFGGLSESQKLSRPPRDFPKDHPEVELLKLKSFTLSTEHKLDPEMSDQDLVKMIIDHFQLITPFNQTLRDWENRVWETT